MGPETETPQEGIWDQVARQEVALCREPLPMWTKMTDMCKNITLPQTLFVGGNKLFMTNLKFDKMVEIIQTINQKIDDITHEL